MSNNNVIFDNDGSIDDLIALLLLLNQKEKISVSAITIPGTGEVHGRQGAQNYKALCDKLGMPEIPVAYGQDKTFKENTGHAFPDWLRNLVDELFANEDFLVSESEENIGDDPVELFIEILKKNKANGEKVTFIATGPLTNIANLLTKINSEPELQDLQEVIDGIVIMGGATQKGMGNIKALDPESKNEDAEWNIYADPAAAQEVFSSNLNIMLVPLEATNQVPMSREFYHTMENNQDISVIPHPSPHFS